MKKKDPTIFKYYASIAKVYPRLSKTEEKENINHYRILFCMLLIWTYRWKGLYL